MQWLSSIVKGQSDTLCFWMEGCLRARNYRLVQRWPLASNAATLVYLLLGNSHPSNHEAVFSVIPFGSSRKGQFHCTVVQRSQNSRSVELKMHLSFVSLRGSGGIGFPPEWTLWLQELALCIGDWSAFFPLSLIVGAHPKAPYMREQVPTYDVHFLEGSWNLSLAVVVFHV